MRTLVTFGGRLMTYKDLDHVDDWWMLSRADAETLEKLRDFVWTFRRDSSHEPIDLLAIAGVTHALDCILMRADFACTISLNWVQRVADEDGFGEGSSCDLTVSQEGIELCKMIYIGGPAGGDHHSERTADLTRDGDFHHTAVEDWIRDCQRIEGHLTAVISGLDLD